MTNKVQVTCIAFERVHPADTSLLGWITCVIDDTLILGDIPLRATDGGVRADLDAPLSVRVTADHRVALQDQLLAALGVTPEATA